MNSSVSAGEASLASALGQHDPRLVQGGVNLDEVDEADGAKIAHHVFGDNEQQVVNQLGGLGGGNALIQKLLPILAPIVMSWLGSNPMRTLRNNIPRYQYLREETSSPSRFTDYE